MKFRFFDIESIQAIWDGRSYIEIDGAMTERDKEDALAAIWEYIGDDALIEHMKLQGFKVERIEESDPTHWCHVCGAMTKAGCNCGPIAANE